MNLSLAIQAQHQNREASFSGLNQLKVFNEQMPSLRNLEVFQLIHRVSLNSEEI